MPEAQTAPTRNEKQESPLDRSLRELMPYAKEAAQFMHMLQEVSSKSNPQEKQKAFEKLLVDVSNAGPAKLATWKWGMETLVFPNPQMPDLPLIVPSPDGSQRPPSYFGIERALRAIGNKTTEPSPVIDKIINCFQETDVTLRTFILGRLIQASGAVRGDARRLISAALSIRTEIENFQGDSLTAVGGRIGDSFYLRTKAESDRIAATYRDIVGSSLDQDVKHLSKNDQHYIDATRQGEGWWADARVQKLIRTLSDRNPSDPNINKANMNLLGHAVAEIWGDKPETRNKVEAHFNKAWSQSVGQNFRDYLTSRLTPKEMDAVHKETGEDLKSTPL